MPIKYVKIDPHLVVEHDRFPLEGGEEAHDKLKNISHITVSKTLIQSWLSFPVADPAWLITLLKGVEPPLKRNLRKLLLGLTESKTAKWREGQS